jgi:hypothetical protein
MLRNLAVAAALCGVAVMAVGCGGSGGTGGSASGGGSPTGGTPVQVSDTFTGTTTQSGPGSCGGDSHNVVAAAGEMSVRLVATSDPAGALSVQLCAGGIDNRDCTINQQKIAVGQALSGARKGEAAQNLKLLPHNCVFGGPVMTTPITYTVTLTYMK